jgi:hypothetical protein
MKKDKVEAFTKSFIIESFKVTKEAFFCETSNDDVKETRNMSGCIY